jgi:hypothetical protein
LPIWRFHLCRCILAHLQPIYFSVLLKAVTDRYLLVCRYAASFFASVSWHTYTLLVFGAAQSCNRQVPSRLPLFLFLLCRCILAHLRPAYFFFGAAQTCNGKVPSFLPICCTWQSLTLSFNGTIIVLFHSCLCWPPKSNPKWTECSHL